MKCLKEHFLELIWEVLFSCQLQQGLFRGTNKKMLLPVSAYLIDHPKGKVLIDTGWDTKYATERPKQLFGMVDKISAPIIEPDEGVDSKLKMIGLLPSDIDHVFISHMDFDHTSGLRLVKEAKDIRCSVEEWNACNKFSLRYMDTWTGICNVGTFAYTQSGIGPVGRSYDVFGDGTLFLVHTPGHSHGLFSVMICGQDDYIVLGNDAAYLQESFSEHRIPGFTVNNQLAARTLDWLIQYYIALIGKKSPKLEETLGYYGEEMVLKAQELGLNTCWAALTHGKSKAIVDKGEKLVCLISIGYGKTQGIEHKNKSLQELCNYSEKMPEWFLDGMKATMLAPTAMNQQKFRFELQLDGTVKVSCGNGFYTKLDLGIVTYHFEAVTNKKII